MDLTDSPQVSLTGRLVRSNSVSRLNKLLDAISAELIALAPSDERLVFTDPSMDAQIEDSNSKRSSVSDWEAHIDTTFSSLRFETDQNSWILELAGDGPADDDGRVGPVQWALKCPNEIVLKHWLHTASRVLTGSEDFAATQRIMHRDSMVLPSMFQTSINENAELPRIQIRAADLVFEK
ncbi:hypothetical protein HK100_011330 [Physocladia obscura]|uniref:Uncharacterized protein n=1 Tax=Physocladia obscura TaxID=109957 RepID=A0AAD5XKQ3_9FUNG|nr:hypothetical protein HK100_011330 [Physocladia obscura]